MKHKYFLIFLCVSLLSCNEDHAPLKPILGTTLHYEGTIESYSVGPSFYSAKQIEMTLSFDDINNVNGFWTSKDNPSYRHYVKGHFTTLKDMYGRAEGKRIQKEEREKTYGTSFKEMSDGLAVYRIRLTEYSDYPGAPNSRATDCAFYVYNFESGKLQGSYYSWMATTVTNGTDSWSTAFSTKFNLKTK